MTGLLKDKIFTISGQEDFREITLQVFNYQYQNNRVYREFIHFLGREPDSVISLNDIPFLPIGFFRDHRIMSAGCSPEIIFESSGTTGSKTSKHYVAEVSLYERSFLKTFRLFYGEPSGFIIIALLPSYVERKSSSLVYMADRLIKESRHSASGFYNARGSEIFRIIAEGKARAEKIIVLGVSFALLDLAEIGTADLSGVIMMETGGMKGKRKEMTRAELHETLKAKFNLDAIHSEYGMTELLSQAYSKTEGIFYAPPWMKVMLRDPQDPLSIIDVPGKTGGINIIDLANLNSCSFISAGDLGRLHDNGGFEVLGRFDNSDIRGCNLMVD